MQSTTKFDIERFLRRAQSVQTLIDGATLAGEREAAILALQRLITQAEQDASPSEIAVFRTRLTGGAKARVDPAAEAVRDDLAFAAWVRQQMNDAVQEAIKIRKTREVDYGGGKAVENNLSDFLAAAEIATKMAHQKRNEAILNPEDWQAQMRVEAEAALVASTKKARETMVEILNRRKSRAAEAQRMSRLRAALDR